MSYDALENEPISTSDPKRNIKKIRDQETGQETDRVDVEESVQSEYRNGMKITEGKVVEGEHLGHAWLRVEGGPTIEGQHIGTLTLAGAAVEVQSLQFHHASIVLEQGQGSGKDPQGFNSIKAKAVVTALPEVFHDEESLQSLSEETVRDDQQRIISRVQKHGDGKVVAERTTYDDTEGVQITTGLHREGPDQGKIFENRRTMGQGIGSPAAIPAYETPRGHVENLRVVSMTSDIRAADTAKTTTEEPGQPPQRVVWLEFQGDWNGA